METAFLTRLVEKEKQVEEANAQRLPHLQRSRQGGFYRMPGLGETCTLWGMRQRPELNGKNAEILLQSPDEHGYFTVRVLDKERHLSSGSRGCRTMKVHPHRLHPEGIREPSSSSPLLDSASALSLSTPSLLSQTAPRSNRSLGSAISASARSLTSPAFAWQPRS